MKKAILTLLICLVAAAASAQSITLKGSTGKEVAFTGLKDATPKGITAQMVADGPIIGLPWDKLDLTDLKANHSEIFAAYQATKRGDTVALKMGSFEDPAMKSGGTERRHDGWYESSSRGVRWMVLVPAGTPKGVLIVAKSKEGDAYMRLMGIEQGKGVFGEFQNKHGFALMTYDYDTKMEAPADIDDFAFAEKGSGQGVLDALDRIAKTAKKPELALAPIAIYGFDKIGAAFAYNFSQWKPERVVAAVVGKGAFYQAVPTEVSAKVPLLILWGEYGHGGERWSSEHNHQHIYEQYRDLNPNWTFAMEKRGKDEETREGDFLSRKFLHDMIDIRVPKAQPKPPEPAPAPTEDGGAAEEGEGAAEPEPEPEPTIPELIGIDRSNSYVGNTETFEVSKMKKGHTPSATETWLPDRDIAQLWKQFSEGVLQVDE